MNINVKAKRILKYILLSLAVIASIVFIAITLFVNSRKDWLLDKLQESVSEIQSGDLEIEELELALFNDLPNISIRLKNIRYYEHNDSLREKNEQPILVAENLLLVFEPWPLVKDGDIIVSSVSIKGGKLNILVYEDNTINLLKAIAKPKVIDTETVLRDAEIYPAKQKKEVATLPETQGKLSKSFEDNFDFYIDLKEISFKAIALGYTNLRKNHSLQLDLDSYYGTIIANTQGLSSNLTSTFQFINSRELPTLTNLGKITLDISLDYVDSIQKVTVNKGGFRVKEILVDFNGYYNRSQNQFIDIEFDASSNDLIILSKLLQEDVMKLNQSLFQKADIDLRGHVYGETENSLPKFDFSFGVKNLSFITPNGKGEFKDIGFEGELHSGDSADYSTAEIMINNLHGQLPGGSVSGNFLLKDYLNPYLRYDLQASMLLDGYDDIFQIPEIDSLQGRINLNANYDGLLNLNNEHDSDSLGQWFFKMDDIGLKLMPTKKTISNLSGTINEFENKILLNDLSLNYNSSDLLINGEFRNLYHFLFNKDKDFEVALDVSSNQLFTTHFTNNNEVLALINDRISDLKLSFIAKISEEDSTDNIYPKLMVQLQHLSFDLDSLPGISDLQGLVNLDMNKDGLSIILDTLQLEMPQGTIDGSGSLFIPTDIKSLNFTTKILTEDFPEEYIRDLIYDLAGKELIDAKNIEASQLTKWSTKLDISCTMGLGPFSLPKLGITNSSLIAHQADSQVYSITNLDLLITDFNFNHEPNTNNITGINSLKADLDIKSIDVPGIKKLPIQLNVEGEDDIFYTTFTTGDFLEKVDSGSLYLNFSHDPPVLNLKYEIFDIPVESIINEYYPQKFIEGRIDASVSLSGEGRDWQKLRSDIQGNISITGDSLLVYGVDIDDILKKYERSQNFNLADLGAVMLVGPFAAVLTKGSDLGRLASISLDSTDQTHIGELVAKWNIHDGMLETEDVAFRTMTQRLAFDGQIDFVNDTIPGYTIYVLDKEGCSLMEQRVYGKMDDLQMDELKIAKTLFGSVINFVKAVVGKNCQPVYNGSVKHPE